MEVARNYATELLRVPASPTDAARLLGTITALFVPRERRLALALIQPLGLWIQADAEGMGSIASLLSDGSG